MAKIPLQEVLSDGIKLERCYYYAVSACIITHSNNKNYVSCSNRLLY